MRNQILAVLLIIYSVFGGGMLDLLDFPMPKPAPASEILDIESPSKEVQERVAVFSDIVTDPTDRAKLAIFNYEFAKRATDYNATNQDVNDIYTLAGSIFFEKTLVDKYESLSEEIVSLMKECVSEDNHILTTGEK